MNLNNYGTGDESTLVKRRPNDLEFLDLDAKFGKSEIGESSTSNNLEPTISDFKEFYYDNCSLESCISLLQSVVNSPHAYSQNKAFTKHIVDALMQSYEEKLNWKFLSLENFMMSGNLLLKLKLKILSFMLCVICVLVSLLSPKLYVIC